MLRRSVLIWFVVSFIRLPIVDDLMSLHHGFVNGVNSMSDTTPIKIDEVGRT